MPAIDPGPPKAPVRPGLLAGMILFSIVAALPAAAGQDANDAFVPFVIPADVSDGSRIAMRNEPIAPNSPRIVAAEGHFSLAGRRVRMWGVNLSFAGGLPSHADAPRVARRLEAFGVNCVRFHHLDTQPWPAGLYEPDPNRRWEPGRKLSEEALDRLDFFIAELARHGVYSDLNLHVGATHSRRLGLPDSSASGPYDKVVGIFTPRLVEAQRQYARELLGRTNRYRGVRLADDPAVAFVEITNEDSFFMWGGPQRLVDMHPYYAGILRGQYNRWLLGRYGGRDGLRTAWSRGAQPLGENLVAPAGQVKKTPDKPDGWWLEQHGDARASARQTVAGTVRLSIEKADGQGWHLQYNCPGLDVKAGQYYTVRFRARADGERTLGFDVGRAHEPWGDLGLRQTVRLGKQWQSVRRGFLAKADDRNARLNFAFGTSAEALEIADVQLQPGGMEGLRDGEDPTADTVALLADGETRQRISDRMRFLAETEKAYFDSMRRCVRDEIGSKALVTGTIVFGPLGLWAQSGMDYIDAHAYWQHPNFPGTPWDPQNWTVEPLAMVQYPDSCPLADLAASRLAGKPFTVSEYNHPATNDYQAECVPMIASFAAAQDWDGVWLYAYSHGKGSWDRDHYDSFFDIDANPAKWGFMPAGAVIFRDAGVQPEMLSRRVSLARGPDTVAELTDLHLRIGSRMGELARRDGHRVPLGERFAVQLHGPPQADANRPDANGHVTWILRGPKEPSPGWFSATGPRARVEVGNGPAIPDGHPEHEVVAIVSLDGRPLEQSRKVLLTACRRCENTGMVFSPDRRTVGKDWGRGPVRIEAIQWDGLPGMLLPFAAVEFDRDGEPWTCTALKPDGTAGQAVPIEGKGDRWFNPSPEYATMWYLFTRGPKIPGPKGRDR